MQKFLDGPAKGQIIQTRRAPILLRVVCKPRNGLAPEKWDALDQPEDTPEPGESIFLYILTAKPISVHLCIRGKGKKGGGFYQMGEYRLLEDPPDDATLRNNALYADWADANKERLTPAWAREL